MAQKIFSTKSGNATISCPECKKARQMDVSKYTRIDKAIQFRVTCSCGHVFPVVLERRRHIRKSVSLKGSLTVKGKTYPVSVADISRGGLKLISHGILDIQAGEKLVVDFILDDAWQSSVSKEVIARKISKTEIGVKFTSQEHYDKLGPYLLFHFS